MQTSQQKENRKRKYQLIFYWLGLMTVLLLLVTATYTWFSLSKTPRVSNMDVYVTSPVGLEIALMKDSEEWGQEVRFADMVSETSPLKPCTWSDLNEAFYAIAYGVDGRMTNQWIELNDEENANTMDSSGYYTKGTFYARSDTGVAVSLSDAVTMDNGTESAGTYLIGSPIWNGQTLVHEDGGSGAEDAIRIGIRVTPMEEGAEVNSLSTFYIYEPNSDEHADSTTEYVETENIDDGGPLVPADRLFTQTASTWSEVTPVQESVVLRNMGKFNTDTHLFTLEKDEMVRIDLYIWLEGQDVDCTNLIGQEAKIFAALQFEADYSAQSGMKPIR